MQVFFWGGGGGGGFLLDDGPKSSILEQNLAFLSKIQVTICKNIELKSIMLITVISDYFTLYFFC